MAPDACARSSKHTAAASAITPPQQGVNAGIPASSSCSISWGSVSATIVLGCYVTTKAPIDVDWLAAITASRLELLTFLPYFLENL